MLKKTKVTDLKQTFYDVALISYRNFSTFILSVTGLFYETVATSLEGLIL